MRARGLQFVGRVPQPGASRICDYLGNAPYDLQDRLINGKENQGALVPPNLGIGYWLLAVRYSNNRNYRQIQHKYGEARE